jgi:hypothetical protein
MLVRITLHLARDRAFPEGSAQHGYEIVAPLDASGHLDAEAWRSHRGLCRVRRFWLGEEDRQALLVHHAGGAGGATWKISYETKETEDDEAGYRLGSHRFVLGEYVSIGDGEGHSHTFKIAEIKPL